MREISLIGAVSLVLAGSILAGCQNPGTVADSKPAPLLAQATVPEAPASDPAVGRGKAIPRRYSYTPKPYPVDDRGFSPVDKALAKAYAREDQVADDAEGSLNPYVLKVISGYPLDGTYPYHCAWGPWEYDIYNGVTQDLW